MNEIKQKNSSIYQNNYKEKIQNNSIRKFKNFRVKNFGVCFEKKNKKKKDDLKINKDELSYIKMKKKLI